MNRGWDEIVAGSIVAIGVGILYYYYSYVDTGKPPTVDVNVINDKLINIDPLPICNVSKSIPIESDASIWEFIINELAQLNSIVISGCSIFIAVFLMYWVPSVFLNNCDSKPKESAGSKIARVKCPSEMPELTELEIKQNLLSLEWTEVSIFVTTAEQCRQASNISTSLFFNRIIPRSDFEFFINKVDFKLLTYRNIFEYYKSLPIDKRDSLVNAYTTYNMVNSNYHKDKTYSAPRAFLNTADIKLQEHNILNSYNLPELYSSTLPEILWNMSKLIYLQKAMYYNTSRLQKEASYMSTHLLFEHRLPSSDFEFFVNHIDFKLLTSTNVFDYHRKLHGHEKDLFLHVYNNYKKAHIDHNTPNSYKVSLSKLYRKLPMQWVTKPFLKLFSKLITKWSTKPVNTDFVNLVSAPLMPIPNEIEIFLKLDQLSELEESTLIWTKESLKDASEISTFLVRQLRLPNSNFENFINHVDFSSLKDRDIFEFYRIVPIDHLDTFIYAYEKYKRS